MNENITSNRTAMLWLSLPIAVAMIIGAAIAGKTVETIKTPKRSIEVKGYAERKIISDIATWEVSVSTSAPALADAYEKLSRDMEAVSKYLSENGIKKEEINIFPVQTNTVYLKNEKGISTNKIEKYTMDSRMKITSKDVQLISRLSGASASLIKKGIEFSSSYPQYYYTKLDDIKIEILGEATKNARMRAAQIAGNSGAEIGPVVWARQGVLQITAPYSMDISDSGQYDTSSIEKFVKSVVTIEYFAVDKQSSKNSKANQE